MVKKLLVKFGCKHKLITNLTEFAPFHEYNESALKAVAISIEDNMHPNLSVDEIYEELVTFVKDANDATAGSNELSKVRNHEYNITSIEYNKVVSTSIERSLCSIA